jgi:hypothetical protein
MTGCADSTAGKKLIRHAAWKPLGPSRGVRRRLFRPYADQEGLRRHDFVGALELP